MDTLVTLLRNISEKYRRVHVVFPMLLLLACLGIGADEVIASSLVQDDLGTPEKALQQAGVSIAPGALMAVLNDREADPDLRSMSAHALGRTRSSVSLSILQQHLADRSDVVRTGVVLGLGSLGNPLVVSDLANSLASDPSANVRQAAVVALRHIGSDTALEALLGAANDQNQSANLRLNALSAVARLTNSGRVSFAQIEPLLLAPDASIRALASIVLAEAGDRRAVLHLVQAATSEETPEGFRVGAMLSLQKIAAASFGYVGDFGEVIGGDAQRAKAIESIRAWWQDNKWRYEN